MLRSKPWYLAFFLGLILLLSWPAFVNAVQVSVSYTYDSLNRLRLATYDVGGKNTSLSYEYDALGNIISYTSSDGVRKPYAYIANIYGDNVSVVDLSTNITIKTIEVGGNPLGVVVSPNGARVYVTDENDNSISVIDTATNTVIDTISVGLKPNGIDIDPTGRYLYVANYYGQSIAVVDTTDKSVSTITVESGPVGVAVSPDGGKVYVANFDSNSLSIVDTVTKGVETVAVGTAPCGVAVNPSGTKVYTANQNSNTVSVFDTATKSVGTISVGEKPLGVAVSPQEDRVYVTNYTSNNVSVIDSSSNIVIKNIPVGTKPHGVALNKIGSRLYVCNAEDGTVSVIDTSNDTIVGTIAVGTFPVSLGKFIRDVDIPSPPLSPDPMTWEVAPNASTSSSITMKATTATGGEPPISYYFVFGGSPTGGTGGTDSGWQNLAAYTNTGLQPNHQYGYQVKARDSASAPNETSPSSPTVYNYTLANAPGQASFSNINQTCVRTNWTVNGNRSGTEFFSENTTQGANSGWTTNLYWDSCGLSCNTPYGFRVKARNGDGIETGWTSLGNQSTLTCPDSMAPVLSITSHSDGQHVNTPSITLSGAASDSGKGDNGIQQVTVNGSPANNGTASGNGTANWSKAVTLSGGPNAITVIAYDNSSNHNQATQSITIYYDVPDTTGPSLLITSHSDGQLVNATSMTLSGTASDSGKGGNGIQQVTVNGGRADNDTATWTGTANWSKVVSLSPGANTLTVIAYDNSSGHNQTSQTITVYYDLVSTIYVSKDGVCNGHSYCWSNIQNGISTAPDSSIIEITQEAYDGNIVLDVDKEIILEGGWDTNFTLCSFYTTINGSITITNGTIIIENIILK